MELNSNVAGSIVKVTNGVGVLDGNGFVHFYKGIKTNLTLGWQVEIGTYLGLTQENKIHYEVYEYEEGFTEEQFEDNYIKELNDYEECTDEECNHCNDEQQFEELMDAMNEYDKPNKKPEFIVSPFTKIEIVDNEDNSKKQSFYTLSSHVENYLSNGLKFK